MRIRFRGVGVGLVLASGLLAHAQLVMAQGGGTVGSRITQAVDENHLVTLRGTVHPLARAQYDRGAVADSQPIRRVLLLLQRSPAQEAALRQLLDDQQTKSSPSFHQWLTPVQFGQQFGPADADVQTVTSWLTGHGFQVNRVSTGRTAIEFSGNAGQVRSAFHTEIHEYVVNGEQHLANDSPVQIPAALAPVVAGLASLHNFPKKAQSHVLGVFGKEKATGQVKPLVRFVPAHTGNLASPTFTFPLSGGCSESVSNCYALGPADFDTIYNVPSPLLGVAQPLDGTGQTIAIVGDSEICTTNSPDFGTTFFGPDGTPVTCSSDDVALFRNLFGLPANSPNVILDGPDPGFNGGDETEGDLDVQWAGAIAPKATIDFVIAENTEASAGIDLAAEHIVDNNLAPVMSESFGDCEADLGGFNGFYSTLWEQAAAQGITVIISAGDSGSAGCDFDSEQTAGLGLAVNGIASTPFNVATGGTDFDYTISNYASTYWKSQSQNANGTQESAIGYIPETTWNDSCAQSVLTGCGSVGSFSSSLIVLGGSGGQSNCLNFLRQLTNGTIVCQTPYPNTSPYYGLFGYPKPSWQPVATASGLTLTTDLTRDLPDVSLFASAGLMSASFYIVCEQDLDEGDAPCSLSDVQHPFTTFIGVGGTSSSAPTFAGIMALVNQKMASLSQNARQGNANYVLYPLYANQVSAALSCNSSAGPNSQCTFNDLTKGNNSVPCIGGAPNCSTTLAGATGDLVDGGVPAWNAGTGYDLATGLGTINASNLITNWATAAGSFTPTTTTLCLVAGNTNTPICSNPTAAVTITHGNFVSSTITVSNTSNQVLPLTSSLTQPEDAALIGAFSGGSAIPVDRFDVNTENPDIYPLTAGTITGAFTQELVGGTYSVHAHYAGDGRYGSSDSNTISVTVNPENSATKITVGTVNPFSGTVSTLSSTPTAVQYGDFNLIRVDVVGASGLETATGSVALTDNGSAIVGPAGAPVGSFTLNSEGYLEDQTTALAVGSHSLVAKYTGTSGSGDGSYIASTSSGVSLNVIQCNTTTAITTPPTMIHAGQQVTITAFVDSATSGNPSGGSSGVNMGGMVKFTIPVQSSMFRTAPPPVGSNWPAASLGASLGLFLLVLLRFPARRRWGVAAVTMLLAAVIGTSVSCGGGSNGNGSGGGGGGTTTLGSASPALTFDKDQFVAGQASITIAPTATETITATYGGDTNYKGSSSTAVTITVQ